MNQVIERLKKEVEELMNILANKPLSLYSQERIVINIQDREEQIMMFEQMRLEAEV